MAIADPKSYATKKETETVDDTTELRAQVAALGAQVQALLSAQQSSGGITADQLEAVMGRLVQVQSDAQQKALREIAERDQRDDVNYPRISVYSYPEGDKARPRPAFKCRMFWNGYDLDWDTTTARELELLNAFDGDGDYTFRRIDGKTLEKLLVKAERNAAGKLSKLEFTFPVKEQRDTLPSMESMLRDALGVKTAEQVEIDRLRKQIEDMRATQAVAQ